MANYKSLSDHTVIIGWQGEASKRMISQLLADHDRTIVLITKKDIENPMPDSIRFIKGDSLTAEDVHIRSNIKEAGRVIVFGETDDETMTAGLAAYTNTRKDDSRVEHIVAYFTKESPASIFRNLCPTAEVFVSPSVELMVRACADPGSTRITNQLVNALNGPTQYSMVMPSTETITTYEDAEEAFRANDATLIGIAETVTGADLVLNPPRSSTVHPGNILYYISSSRLDPLTII